MTRSYQRTVLRKADVFPKSLYSWVSFCSFFFLAVVLATWHMRPFPTRDQTHSPGLGNGESSLPVEWVHLTGPPGKSSAAFKCGSLLDCHLCHIPFFFKTLFLSVHTEKSSEVSNFFFFFLDLRSANFLWKDPDRKYFRLCRQYGLLQLKCWSTHRQVNK